MNDERYDYRASMKADIREYISENHSEKTIDELLQIREELNDEMWTADSVTGNASGSYWCNTWKAESALCHNFDLVSEMLGEFGMPDDNDKLTDAEWLDVSIRCYLLGECLDAVLDEMSE